VEQCKLSRSFVIDSLHCVKQKPGGKNPLACLLAEIDYNIGSWRDCAALRTKGKMSADITISEQQLTDLCAAVLTHLGIVPEQAVNIARNLVDADLRGIASHGVVRLPIYAERLHAGAVNPRPNVRIIHETATAAVVDGNNGMGQWVAAKSMQVAIDKGCSGNCAFVAVRNSNHFGAAAYYSRLAVEHDMIGISFTIGGINHMAPWGGAEAILGNNPFSVALPAGEECPIVLDMACSVAARGKIIVAAKDNTSIPDDWATGPDGRPTSDPVEALKGFMLPVGGPKGYSLTLVVGLLSTMLSGACFGTEVTHMYEDLKRPQNVGHLFGVLPIATFESIETYKKRMDKAIREVRNVKRAPGVERIYMPGEREDLLVEQHRQVGVSIKQAVWAELQEVAKRFGCAV
jgi:LDH2 family malate/lactate/ureidoglycolate dehydrogenase